MGGTYLEGRADQLPFFVEVEGKEDCEELALVAHHHAGGEGGEGGLEVGG